MQQCLCVNSQQMLDTVNTQKNMIYYYLCQSTVHYGLALVLQLHFISIEMLFFLGRGCFISLC